MADRDWIRKINQRPRIEVTATDTTVDATTDTNTSTTINVDFGSAPLQSGSFTITVAASTVGSLVQIHEAAETIAATGEEADRLECDQVLAHGRVTAATTATIWWLSIPGPVSGIRRFAYQIATV